MRRPTLDSALLPAEPGPTKPCRRWGIEPPKASSSAIYSRRLNQHEKRGKERRFAFLAVGLILGFAAWSRWPLLREGLWADESLTVYLARSKSLAELIARCRIADYSPPLFHLLLGGWGRLFGFGEVAVKSLVFVLGLGGIAAAALAAGEMFGPVAAVLAAVLVANNRLAIEMSAEVRPYMLSAALAGFALFFLFRLRRFVNERRAPTAAQIGATAAFVLFGYSHYAGMFAVAIVGMTAAAALAIGREPHFWRRVAVSAGFAGLTFLPWLPIFEYQRKIGLPWAPQFTAALLWERFVTKVGDFFPIVCDGPTAGSWIGVAILMFAIGTSEPARRAVRKRATPLMLCFILSLLCYFLVAFVAPASRYLTVGVIFSALLASGFLSSAVPTLESRRKSLVWVGIALVAGGSFIGRLWQYEEIRHNFQIGLGKSGIRTAFEKNRFGPTDVLIAIPDAQSQSLWFYSRDSSLIRGFPRWSDPIIPDYEHYDRDWTDPNAIENAWASLQEDVREHDAKRIVLFDSAGDFALSSGCARDFDDFLHAKLRVILSRAYAGRIEGTRMTIFAVPRK